MILNSFPRCTTSGQAELSLSQTEILTARISFFEKKNARNIHCTTVQCMPLAVLARRRVGLQHAARRSETRWCGTATTPDRDDTRPSRIFNLKLRTFKLNVTPTYRVPRCALRLEKGLNKDNFNCRFLKLEQAHPTLLCNFSESRFLENEIKSAFFKFTRIPKLVTAAATVTVTENEYQARTRKLKPLQHMSRRAAAINRIFQLVSCDIFASVQVPKSRARPESDLPTHTPETRPQTRRLETRPQTRQNGTAKRDTSQNLFKPP